MHMAFSAHAGSKRFAGVIVAVLGMAASGLGGQAAAAENFTGVYSVSLVGLSLGNATVSGKFGANDYRIEAYANLTGLASAVSGAKGSAVATGLMRGAQPAPNSYATTSSNSKETRTVRIGMNSGNVRAVDIQPPFEALEGRVPIMEGHKRSVVDPLSALIMPLRDGEAAGPAACRRTIPVFDGFTRFDVSLAYVGTRKVAVQGYKGPVIVCNARYRPIAGHRPNRKATQFMVNNKDMEVWLAPLGDSKIMVPYRIAVRTMIGMTVIEARKFLVTGGNRAESARR